MLIAKNLPRILCLSGLCLVLTTLDRVEARPTAPTAPPTMHAGFPRTDPTPSLDFGSPSVLNLTGDAKLEILVVDGDSCVYGWDSDGNPLAGFPYVTFGPCDQDQPRARGPLAIADIDQDGALEIVVGTRGQSNTPGQRGKVYVLNAQTGQPKWVRETNWSGGTSNQSEIVTVALADLTGDGRLEVIAGSNDEGVDPAPNLYAWDSAGNLLSGNYPTGYKTAGIFGHVAASDIAGDGKAEIVVARDHLYVHAYNADGTYVTNWPVRTYYDLSKTTWGEDPYLAFTNNAPVVVDLNGDGGKEIITAGKVFDPHLPSGSNVVASALLVLEADGGRPSCWLLPPLGGASLSTRFPPNMAPAIGDINQDGRPDIVVTMFDGVARAYHFNGRLIWEYNYAQGLPLFASEPVIGDVTGDGKLDVLFGTYSPDQNAAAQAAVRLIGLSATGQPLAGFPLTLPAEPTSGSVGIRAAPTLADVDNDGLVEIVAASWGSAVYMWDTDAPYNANLMPWPTGRGNALRNGDYNFSSTALVNQMIEPNLLRASGGLSHTIFFPLIRRESCTW